VRSDAYENMHYCLLVLAQLEDVAGQGGTVGNSDIARYTKLSRQTVNKLMDKALGRGYCSVQLVLWRKNDGQGNPVYAKRYSVGKLWADMYRQMWASRFKYRQVLAGRGRREASK
jgi:hypothetical protein